MISNYNFSKLRTFLDNRNLFSVDAQIESLLFLQNPYFKEKRKRLQIHESLNYYLSKYSTYDFFTPDVVDLLHKSEALAIFFNTEFVTSDMVLHMFFDLKNPKLEKLFKEMNIKEKKSEEYLIKKWRNSLTSTIKRKNPFLKKISQFFSLIFRSYLIKKKIITKKILYSEELNKVIENTIKKARLIYKTPVISAELFLLALLEQKESYSRQLFVNLIPSLKYLLQFRYKVLRHMQRIEKRMFRLLPKGLIFFDYLFKTHLTSAQFYHLTAFPIFHYYAVLTYRNKIIKKILFYKYPQILKSEIVKEILYKFKKNKNKVSIKKSKE
jgi:hypothetical protein